MTDVVALGELLIDFTPQQQPITKLPSYTANPGGAPANVVVALAQLGYDTAMIASVGKDALGTLLIETLKEKGVQTEGVMISHIPTTLAFVHIGAEGERSFSFYRQPGADTMLTKEAISKTLLNETKIIHFGSLSMTNQPTRNATRFALEFARTNEKVISYDPNYRPMLWEHPAEAKKYILEIMQYAHIVKVSEEELNFLTKQGTLKTKAKELIHQYEITLLFVTLGEQGSYCFHQNGSIVFIAGITVEAVDTTGCGDAFFAGVLSQILIYDIDKLDEFTNEVLQNITSYGNSMGAYVATKYGAIPAMPNREALDMFFK